LFQGSNALTMDAKGRISIPTRHRDALLSRVEGRLTLTRHPDGCLLVYPRNEWEKKREQIAAFPMQARSLQRLLLGYAQDVQMDSAGRILIAPELRQAAGLEREVLLMGMASHFELWDNARWEHQEAEDLANGVPAAMEHFSF